MNKLKDLFFTFSCVTTGSLTAAAIFITTFDKDTTLSVGILWQILLTSAISSLGNFMYPNRALTKHQLYLFKLLHYLYVNLVVIGSGLIYEWFYLDQLHMILSMAVLVAIVFSVINYAIHCKAKRDTELMNAQLQKYKKTNHM